MVVKEKGTVVILVQEGKLDNARVQRKPLYHCGNGTALLALTVEVGIDQQLDLNRFEVAAADTEVRRKKILQPPKVG
jgi:hypothetical protein